MTDTTLSYKNVERRFSGSEELVNFLKSQQPKEIHPEVKRVCCWHKWETRNCVFGFEACSKCGAMREYKGKLK